MHSLRGSECTGGNGYEAAVKRPQTALWIRHLGKTRPTGLDQEDGVGQPSIRESVCVSLQSVLRTGSRASCLIGQCSVTELHPQLPSYFESGILGIAQVILQLAVYLRQAGHHYLLTQPLDCWFDRCVPPHWNLKILI